MTYDTLVGTGDGVVALEDGLRPLGLTGHRISALHAFRSASGGDVLLAGTYGEGLFRSEDRGRTWQEVEGLWAPAARTVGPDPSTAGALLCGTEPGRLFRSRDEGRTWTELTGVGDLPQAAAWFLPYSPRAGAIRNLTARPERPARLLASVEVGGLLRTDDGGETWSVAAIAGNDDIHQIVEHPDDPDRLWASLGYAALPDRQRRAPLGGVARSRDGGRTWTVLHTEYTRSTIFVPGHPDLVLSGPAPDVGSGGRIVVSDDDGETWLPAAGGVSIPMPDMVELFQPAPDGRVFAICAGGRLLGADPGDWRWSSALPAGAPENVVSVSFLPR
ncbi:MAG: sialidase family protein [Candidatus Dormiibacterota bacterium]